MFDNCRIERGFTLIELMIVVMMIAIMTAIALPSYQRYIVKNAESEVQAQIGRLETELERWRTTALTYRGFYPSNGISPNNNKPVYGYAEDNKVIYVPLGSNSNNYRYKIELVDGGDNQSSLATVGLNEISGRSWVMRAEPNPTGVAGKTGFVYLQRSTGLRCATMVANKDKLPISKQDCQDAGLETW